jgi:protein PhnA
MPIKAGQVHFTLKQSTTIIAGATQRNSQRLNMDITVKDSNGATLNAGDSVQVNKDLKVKGTSITLKRGTVIKNIRLTDDEEEIECNADKIKGLVLKTCFLKKV